MDETMKKLLKLLLEQEDGNTEAGQKRPNSRNTAPSDSSGDMNRAKQDMELANRSRQVSEEMAKTQHASHEKPLSPEQQAYVQQLLEGAPEALRSSISKAIIASIQATDQF